jgi:Tfp pilus assembly protein PilX
MKSRKPMVVRVLDAVQGRFRRARPGSVLIMVVSLLVLLALIGTAAMSTSRLDRTSSVQNV